MFDEELARQGKVDKSKTLPQSTSKHLTIHVKSYNSYGSSVSKGAIDAKNLIVIRFQLKNVSSEH